MPSPDLGLVTVQQLKDELLIPSSDTVRDTLIAKIIARGSRLIEGVVRRHLVYPGSDYIDTFDIEAANVAELHLGDYPIKTITGIWEDFNRVYGSDTLRVEGQDFLVDYENGVLQRVSGQAGYYWAFGYRSIKVQYSAGFVDSADKGNVPAEAAEVMMKFGVVTFREIESKQQGRKVHIASDTGGKISLADRFLATARLSAEMIETLDPIASIEYPAAYTRYRSLPPSTP
jgi:hypothetical protein